MFILGKSALKINGENQDHPCSLPWAHSPKKVFNLLGTRPFKYNTFPVNEKHYVSSFQISISCCIRVHVAAPSGGHWAWKGWGGNGLVTAVQEYERFDEKVESKSVLTLLQKNFLNDVIFKHADLVRNGQEN